MPTPRANITESVLIWARKQAGYSPEDAARKLNVKEERYLSWEDADDDLKPTIKQLRNIAKLYKRPVSLFYLPEPPEGFQPMRDLRRLPGDRLGEYSPALRFEMERAQQRREVALDLFQTAGDDLEKFGLKASVLDDPETVGAAVRTALGVNFSDQKTWRRKGTLEPFKAWRRAIEAYGVLVFQMSGIETDEVNGFALAAEVLPIIAVNRGDVPNRRTFSLLHEFSHLLLNLSGVSDLDVDTTRPPEEQRIEVFCNHVAAAALMPKEHVLSAPMVRAHPGKSTGWSDSDIRTVSDQFGVSREAFLRRLATFERTTFGFYRAKAEQYNEEWRALKARQKAEYKESKKKFSKNPPQDVFVELGRPFVRLVLNGVRQDLMTLNEASGYFNNLRIRHFPKLEERAFTG